jgi:hypothetical protein
MAGVAQSQSFGTALLGDAHVPPWTADETGRDGPTRGARLNHCVVGSIGFS